jgi:hypothetical protein
MSSFLVIKAAVFFFAPQPMPTQFQAGELPWLNRASIVNPKNTSQGKFWPPVALTLSRATDHII